MKKIGQFIQEGRLYRGFIATLHMRAEALLLPRSAMFGARVTDFTVTAENAHGFGNEIGVARLRQFLTGETNIPYFTVELDDPSFAVPVNGILWRNAAESWDLYWSRGVHGQAGAETLYMQEEMKPPLGVGRTPTKLTDYVRELCPNLQL